MLSTLFGKVLFITILTIGLSLPMGGFAAEVAQPGAVATAAPRPDRIRIAIPGDLSVLFDKAIQEVVNKFNAGQKKFKVELLVQGDSFQTLKQIIAANYAAALPDLALVNQADVETLAGLHIIEPVPTRWFLQRKFLLSILSSTKCEHKECSIPLQRQVPVWYFNRELLFKFNLEKATPPSSFGKLAPMLPSFTKANETSGLAVPVSGPYAMNLWNGIGLSPLISGRFNSALDTISDWALKTLKAKPTIWLPGVVPAHPGLSEATKFFLEQKAVILLGHMGQWNYLRDMAKFKIGSAVPSGALAWFGTDIVQLKKKDGAVPQKWINEFLDYLYKPETMLTLEKASYSLPLSRLYIENPMWRKEMNRWPTLSDALYRSPKPMELEKVAPNAREEVNAAVWAAIETPLGDAEQPAARAATLRATLEKLLSSKPR